MGYTQVSPPNLSYTFSLSSINGSIVCVCQMGVARDSVLALEWWGRSAYTGAKKRNSLRNDTPRWNSSYPTDDGYQFGTTLKYHCRATLERYIQMSRVPSDMILIDNICYIIGRCYADGIGTAIHHEIAIEWWKKATTESTTKKSTGWCEFAIGCAFESKQSIKFAMEWFTKSIHHGNTLAAQRLADIYRDGYHKNERIEKDEKKAFELMMWSAEQSLLPSHSWISKAPLTLGTWYHRGTCTMIDWMSALKWYTLASNQPNGNGDSEHWIGGLYFKGGYGIHKDEQLSYQWSSKAAQLGHSISQYNLAIKSGQGTTRDDTQAFELMLRSAEQGYSNALYFIGCYYHDGFGTCVDYLKAISWWEKLSKHHDSNGSAENEIGVMYQHGKGVPKDAAVAVKWYRKGALRGNSVAQRNLAIHYTSGNGVTKDERWAFEWMLRSAQQNEDYLAPYLVGDYYSLGIGTSVDHAKAMEWWKKSSDHNDCDGRADNHIGVAYDRGNGVIIDEKEAMKWYRKGAERGCAAAQYNLALCYINDQTMTKNEALAFAWMLRSAQQNHGNAQLRIGTFYCRGIGPTSIDYSRALEWWKKSSQHDDSGGEADNNIGIIFSNGDGVPKDDTEAFKWYLRGAERGYAKAQHNLALCYEKGEGVIRNNQLAFEWMLRSAQQNDRKALFCVGNYYQNGIGTPVDYLAAIEWWKKAVENSDPSRDAIKVLKCRRCTCRNLIPMLLEPTVWLRDHDMLTQPKREWSSNMRALHFEFGARLGLRIWRTGNDEKKRNHLITFDGANAAVYPARLRQSLNATDKDYKDHTNDTDQYPLVAKCIFNYDDHAQTTRTLMVHHNSLLMCTVFNLIIIGQVRYRI
jgi:TPR repeat protein